MSHLFGTDGIRARVGEYPLTLNNIQHLGHVIYQWAEKKYGPRPRFLLAHDTRLSCSWLKATLKNGLLRHPTDLYDAEVLPTPAVFHLLKQTQCHAGIIISASHNPYYDNGIKIIDSVTGKLSLEDEQELSRLFYAPIENSIDYEQLGHDTILHNAHELYARHIVKLFAKNFLSGLRIVLDTAHGATSVSAEMIFKALGAETILINNTPNGININHQCGALHLESLQQAVINHHADVGFSFDGDGDRVMAVNSQGVIKNGDDILALLSTHPDYTQMPAIVGTIMSNQGLEAFLHQHNKKLLRTAVGDKYVSETLTQENLLLGGEQSGHIILKNMLATGDGILAALKVLETILLTENRELESFEKFPQFLINLPVKEKKDLSLPPFSDLITQTSSSLPTGRLVIRYSGTENYLRIMIEEKDHYCAQEAINHLSQQLQKLLT